MTKVELMQADIAVLELAIEKLEPLAPFRSVADNASAIVSPNVDGLDKANLAQPHLRPCPCCGSSDVRLMRREFLFGMEAQVGCRRCRMSSPKTTHVDVLGDRAAKHVVEIWNRRDGEMPF